MSASAPLSSSASSSAAPTAASAASTPFIAYDLRDGSGNVSLAPPNVVRLPPSALISDLQQAVFDAARLRLPERYDYLALDVYPPGSSGDVLSDHSLARDPEDAISSLLPAAEEQNRIKRRIIIVARPLPSTAGVQGERQATAVQTNPLSSLPSVYTHPSLFHCHLLCSMFCSELTNRAGSRHGEDHKRNRRIEGY